MIDSALVNKLAHVEGYAARRMHTVRLLPAGIEIEIEALAFHNLGDEQRPIIVSNEPLAQQMERTNVPNRPADMQLYDNKQSTVTLILRVDVLAAQVVRMRLYPAQYEPRPDDSSMLAPDALETFPTQPEPILRHSRGTIEASIGSLTLTLQADPFALNLRQNDDGATIGQTIFGTSLSDRGVHGLLCTPTPGIYIGQNGQPEAFWSWAIEPDEHFYGLGEHFNTFDQRGHTVRLWNQDAWGTTTEAAYKNVPFLLSSQHYGVFFHTSAPLTLHLGTSSARSALAQVSDAELDLFLILGETPKDILTHYTQLTGRASMPPRWALGVWMSRCRYESRAEVEAIARRQREEQLPCDVLHIDPAWLRYPNLCCDFVASEAAFPDLKGLVRSLGEQGFKVSLWELPYLSAQSPRYHEAAAAGYLLRTASGDLATVDISTPPADGYARGLVDFTNPAAVAWWQNLHREWLQAGVAVFKADFGEGVPLNARAYNGMSGHELHNLYPLLYNAAVHGVIEQETGRPGMLWGRSGWAGIQRYPAQWGGDPKTDVWSMRSSLRGGLGLALSAPGLWTHDIGGFYGPPPSAELYIRWAQFGLLSPLTRAHGTTPREPWEFGERALEIFKRYAQLRMRLNPYLYSVAWDAHEQGWPCLRPLVLEFPDDPGTAMSDDVYMLGESLLVAPIFSASPEPVTRTFYVPDGEWYDFWSDERINGGRYLKRVVPLETIPLYVRAGAILPLGPVVEHLSEQAPDEITLEIYLGRENSTRIIWDAQGQATAVTLRQHDSHWQLHIDGEREVRWHIRWHDGQSIREQTAGPHNRHVFEAQ